MSAEIKKIYCKYCGRELIKGRRIFLPGEPKINPLTGAKRKSYQAFMCPSNLCWWKHWGNPITEFHYIKENGTVGLWKLGELNQGIRSFVEVEMGTSPTKGSNLRNQLLNKESFWQMIKETKGYDVIAFIIMEAIGVIGALPLIRTEFYPSAGRRFDWGSPSSEFPRALVVYKSLWDNTGALISFLFIATVLTIFYTRYQSRKVQILTTLLVLCILLLTVFGTKAFK